MAGFGTLAPQEMSYDPMTGAPIGVDPNQTVVTPAQLTPVMSDFGKFGRLAGAVTGIGSERAQLWPEKMVRSGFTLPHDAAAGDFIRKPEVPGQWSEIDELNQNALDNNLVERTQDLAGMAGGASAGSSLERGAGGVGRDLRVLGKQVLAEDSAVAGAPVAALSKQQPFYSGVERAVEAIPQARMTGDAWLGTLRNKPGVKPEEMDWTGLKQFLSERADQPVTKQEVAAHIGENRVQLNEVVKEAPKAWENLPPREQDHWAERFQELTGRHTENNPDWEGVRDFYHGLRQDGEAGGTRYSEYQLPGGDNYRETLLTLPTKKENVIEHRVFDAEGRLDSTRAAEPTADWMARHAPGGRVESVPVERSSADNYRSSHWDEPNVVAHMRMNDRAMPLPPTPEEAAAYEAHRAARPQLDAIRNQQNDVGREIRTSSALLNEARRDDIVKAMRSGEMTVGDANRALEQGFNHPELAPLQNRLTDLRAQEGAIRRGLPPAPEPRSARSLHLEEIQSDWHQAARAIRQKEIDRLVAGGVERKAATANVPSDFGYAKVGHNGGPSLEGVPDAPFKTAWHELALKRALHEAAVKGYDRLSWTPGEAQAARYDLSKQIKRLEVNPVQDQSGLMYEVRAFDHQGNDNNFAARPSELPNHVGKEMAQKIVDDTQSGRPISYSGLDLKVGGEGMKGFYDNIVPKALEKLTGVKVQQGEIPGARIVQRNDGFFRIEPDGQDRVFGSRESAQKAASARIHYIDIPPALRERASRGFSMFEDSGMAGAPLAALEKAAKGPDWDAALRGAPYEPARAEAGGHVGGGLEGPAGGAGGLEEAQGAAARRAGAKAPLEGLPTKPLRINGEHFVPGPIEKVHDVAERYMATDPTGRGYHPPTKYHPIDEEHSAAIAKAFDEMPHTPDDPATKASYKALIDETMAQWQHIKDSGLKVEFIKPGQPDPYAANPRLAAKDVGDNNHLWVFPTDQGFGSSGPAGGRHPMLQSVGETIDGKPAVANDVFRIVHDYFGHLKDGNGFRAAGEDNAWRSHSAMYSDVARPAMTTETRGQNSWVNYGPHGEFNRKANAAETHYADQKVGLMPEWTMRDRGSPDPIIAYHGGANDFGKFDSSKIGVGEGNQAYGHGLYFAGNEPVSEWYRHQISARRDPVLAKHGLDAEQGANVGIELAQAKGNPAPIIQSLKHEVASLRAEGRADLSTKNMIRDRENKIAYLQDPERAKGRMYQVAIDANPEHFLDWDAALKGQHPVVKKAMQPWVKDQVDLFNQAYPKTPWGTRVGDIRPEDAKFLQKLKSGDIEPKELLWRQRDQARAASELAEQGVPGIKYRDQLSRVAPTPTQRLKSMFGFEPPASSHNYVTFDDSLVRILRKYGMAGLTVGGAGFGSLAPGKEDQ